MVVALLQVFAHGRHHWFGGAVWFLISLLSFYRGVAEPRKTAFTDPFAPISLFNGDIPR